MNERKAGAGLQDCERLKAGLPHPSFTGQNNKTYLKTISKVPLPLILLPILRKEAIETHLCPGSDFNDDKIPHECANSWS